MSADGKLDIILFALTGFGNPVLNALLDDDRCRVRAVFTVKYKDPFPYYPEVQLGELCTARDVPCYFNVKVGSPEGLALLRAYAPDLIVVATFKQILSADVLGIPRLGTVNFHPSLLPRYRGPCPTNAALLNGDSVTGVTAHYVTEALDEGNILLQKSVVIDETDNDGRLRKKLALLAAEMTPELIIMLSKPAPPVGIVQDHALATSAPRPRPEDGYLELASDVETACRMIRALNPLPGITIASDGARVFVRHCQRVDDDRPHGLHLDDAAYTLILHDGALRLTQD